jgi:hypothetical protein
MDFEPHFLRPELQGLLLVIDLDSDRAYMRNYYILLKALTPAPLPVGLLHDAFLLRREIP